MHLKIQGGGKGRVANQGSSSSLISYLQHEDLKNIKEGKKTEPFFSHSKDQVNPNKLIDLLDNNKRKLSKKDAKFYMLTLSPSKEELEHIGNNPEKRSQRLKKFVRDGLMQEYAKGFNKGLEAKDIMYFGKVHYERKSDDHNDLHIHIVISRKSKNGKRKISPQTNHKKTQKGPVKGGFSRVDFFDQSEKNFDRHFFYRRKKEQHFSFKKRYKKAKPKELKQLINEKHRFNEKMDQEGKQMQQHLTKQGFDTAQIEDLFNGKTIKFENSNTESSNKYFTNEYYLETNDNGTFELCNKANDMLVEKKSNLSNSLLNAFKFGLGQDYEVQSSKQKEARKPKKERKSVKKIKPEKTRRPKKTRKPNSERKQQNKNPKNSTEKRNRRKRGRGL